MGMEVITARFDQAALDAYRTEGDLALEATVGDVVYDETNMLLYESVRFASNEATRGAIFGSLLDVIGIA